jgi:hypothetical protein
MKTRLIIISLLIPLFSFSQNKVDTLKKTTDTTMSNYERYRAMRDNEIYHNKNKAITDSTTQNNIYSKPQQDTQQNIQEEPIVINNYFNNNDGYDNYFGYNRYYYDPFLFYPFYYYPFYYSYRPFYFPNIWEYRHHRHNNYDRYYHPHNEYKKYKSNIDFNRNNIRQTLPTRIYKTTIVKTNITPRRNETSNKNYSPIYNQPRNTIRPLYNQPNYNSNTYHNNSENNRNNSIRSSNNGHSNNIYSSGGGHRK